MNKPSKAIKGYDRRKSMFGEIDKLMGGIFAAVLISILLWIGSTTHRNTVLLATVATELQSYRELTEARLRTLEKRQDHFDVRQQKVLRYLGRDLK